VLHRYWNSNLRALVSVLKICLGAVACPKTILWWGHQLLLPSHVFSFFSLGKLVGLANLSVTTLGFCLKKKEKQIAPEIYTLTLLTLSLQMTAIAS
jgi:hypothetical protein